MCCLCFWGIPAFLSPWLSQLTYVIFLDLSIFFIISPLAFKSFNLARFFLSSWIWVWYFWLYTNSTAIFDRSGRYVITGSDDRLVKIWSMETAYCLASCRGHEVSLMSYNAHILQLFMFLSLISSSYMLHYFLFGWKGDITDLAVSSNNFMVASSSNDCIIRVVSIPFILLILSSLPA